MEEEEKITVKIDKDGNIISEVHGVVGPSCVDKVSELLEGLAEIDDMKKTDGYFMDPNVLEKTKSTNKLEVKK